MGTDAEQVAAILERAARDASSIEYFWDAFCIFDEFIERTVFRFFFLSFSSFIFFIYSSFFFLHFPSSFLFYMYIYFCCTISLVS